MELVRFDAQLVPLLFSLMLRTPERYERGRERGSEGTWKGEKEVVGC